ncbi:Vacuolar protein sorting-associated protein 9A [Turnera subulata]|uniref:Vacuolar protein sorting-associated protein 9A n=1 Tax=Turnera subulata TaxID=218843 RepID=A0A9Q0GKG0_9ROSI|nr:Vacuolar protein sorting-associated protein 9A [Turnera subulata]
MENADVFLGLHDFLERMRQPSASDFVKSIKSFIVSFSNNAPDPERDSAMVQEFLANMEAAFRAHPLWAGCSEEELESAGEGLEKYVMTKLFTRVFASLPDDVKVDDQLSQKMSLIQQFIRPENLDIKPTFQNESSWLLAQKELQKINMYKAPRDKLVCILNCCKVINNLLLNASIASNDSPPGADEFLPVLIYVTIKANPPQLHSNLLYIQRYRRQSRLVSEAAYFFTNILSAESFISNIDAKSLSMEETEFERNMEFARALLSGFSTDSDGLPYHSDQSAGSFAKAEPLESRHKALSSKKESDLSNRSDISEARSTSKDTLYAKEEPEIGKVQSLEDIENKGATMLLKEEDFSKGVFREYPYLYAQVGDLTINDVEELLNNYKQLVFKYVCLSKGLGGATPSLPLSNSQTDLPCDTESVNEEHQGTEAVNKEHQGTEPADSKSQKHTDVMDDSNIVSHVSKENVESKPHKDELVAPH